MVIEINRDESVFKINGIEASIEDFSHKPNTKIPSELANYLAHIHRLVVKYQISKEEVWGIEMLVHFSCMRDNMVFDDE